ncbi:molybdate ABC transporter substrate-binding protein, partial [Escherichia coli]|nr:molybdate ABC transporter substrate-binding protein [Escherichia coli]
MKKIALIICCGLLLLLGACEDTPEKVQTTTIHISAAASLKDSID